MAGNSNNNEQKTDEFSEHLKVKEKDEQGETYGRELI